jgi:hypothetical protein
MSVRRARSWLSSLLDFVATEATDYGSAPRHIGATLASYVTRLVEHALSFEGGGQFRGVA